MNLKDFSCGGSRVGREVVIVVVLKQWIFIIYSDEVVHLGTESHQLPQNEELHCPYQAQRTIYYTESSST